ncbi:MAG: hypothetical protein GXP36_15040, partial [Actinobacteria bacterium]|nr:hypothetical protein [Actinomycetota bacterium]
LWPWPLTALTGGAIGAWLLGVGVGVGHALWENDLRRVSPWMSGYVLFGLLEVVAVPRFAGGESGAGEMLIDWGRPKIWAFLLVAVSIVIAAGWALLITPRHEAPGSLALYTNE